LRGNCAIMGDQRLTCSLLARVDMRKSEIKQMVV
jgi:hypothetical protein